MPKMCDVCGIEYVNRCRQERYHEVIVGERNQKTAKRLIKILGEAVDEGRKAARTLIPNSQIKSRASRNLSRNIPYRVRFARTLRLR
jgi:type VI protein secretion system component VasF